MLKYLYTFYKNANDDGSRAEIGKSHLVRLSAHDQYPYCNLIGILSTFFAKAQMYKEHGLIDQPAHLSIVVNQQIYRKFKQQDGDTQLHRLLWLIENFADPDCGAVVSIYVTDDTYEYEMMDEQWSLNSLWHTKQIYTGHRSKYVTLAAHSEDQPHHEYNKGNCRHNIAGWVELVRDYAHQHGYEVVEVDYTTSIDKLYELLINARAHYTYMGATAYFAGITRTPTHILGLDTNHSYPIGQRYSHITPNHEVENITLTPYGTWGSKPGHVLQKSFDWDKMVLDDVTHLNVIPIDRMGEQAIDESFTV